MNTLKDVEALVELNSLIDIYLPWSGSALDPRSLKIIINDIIINNRSTIVECGSGISTFYIGSILKQNSFLDGKIYSIENDKKWLKVCERYINLLGISSYVEIIHAPLKPFENKFRETSWYDTKIVSDKLKDISIDQLIIDGPPAYKHEISFSRYPAVPFLKSKLSEEFSIFLDDSDRKAEIKILKEWEKKLGINFKNITTSNNMALGVKGEIFNIT